MRASRRAVVFLTLVMALALSASPALAALEFSDVPADHPFYNEIMMLAEGGVISGYADGLFRPNDFVMRAQAAKILVMAEGRHTEEIDSPSPGFWDVPPEIGIPYPFDFIGEACGAGYFQGKWVEISRSNDAIYMRLMFLPWDHITRAQLALVLARAGSDVLESPPAGYDTGFTDVPEYAREAVAVLKYNEVLQGTSATTFSPWTLATRGHVAKMVAGLLSQAG